MHLSPSLAHALNMRNKIGCSEGGFIRRTKSPKASPTTKRTDEKVNFFIRVFIMVLTFLGIHKEYTPISETETPSENQYDRVASEHEDLSRPNIVDFNHDRDAEISIYLANNRSRCDSEFSDTPFESMEYDPDHSIGSRSRSSSVDSSTESSPISSSVAPLHEDLVEERQTKKVIVIDSSKEVTDHSDVSKYQSHIEAVALQFQLSLTGIMDAYQNPLEV